MSKLQVIQTKDLIQNRFQPRKQFSQESIEELARSIEEVGLLHPPLVRKIPGSHLFEIISGERRVQAHIFLKKETIAVVVSSETSDDMSAKAALIENIQRVDLNPMEVAEAIQQLIILFSATQQEIAEKLGKKRSTISNYLRLFQLPEKIQGALREQALSMAHAKVLLAAPEKLRFELFELAISKKLSVRELEKNLEKSLEKTEKQSKKKPKDVFAEDLVRRLEAHLGLEVEIEAKHNKGKVVLHFHDLDDLERIVDLLSSDEKLLEKV